MLRIVMLGLGVLALAGCQKKPEAASPAAGEAAQPAASVAPVSMDRKAGLWSQTISTGGQTQTMKLCIDAATDKQMQITGQAMGKDMCSENTITPAAGGMSFKSVCTSPGGGTTTTTGAATGDFGSHYVVKATSVTTGSSMPQADGTHDMSIEATWEGPCPAGMAAGDMQVNGMTINVSKMMAGMAKGPAAGK